MGTRVKLELDPETFGRLVASAIEDFRSADWQAEVILRRALGTWDESRVGYGVLATDPKLDPATRASAEAEHVPA